jgi:regulator of sigma E protease
LRYGLYFKITDATPGMRLREAWLNAVDFVRLVRISLTQLFTGKAGIRDMSGPIGIVNTLNDIGEESASVIEGLQNVLYIAALIAVNLAVMNLLPLPALDGGRIFFLAVTWLLERIFRRKIDPKYEGYIHAGGLILLLGLMAIVSFSDIAKIVSQFL